MPDFIEVGQPGETWAIRFANVEEVFKPGTTNVVEAPKDLAAWLQHHPYLKTGKPEPITVGGVKGVEFDVVAEAPEEHTSICGTDCVDVFKQRFGRRSKALSRRAIACSPK